MFFCFLKVKTIATICNHYLNFIFKKSTADNHFSFITTIGMLDCIGHRFTGCNFQILNLIECKT